MVDEETQKPKQENTESGADESSKDGVSKEIQNEESTEPDRLSEAKKTVAELKAENDRREKLLKEEKEFEAERLISGRGKVIKEKADPLKDPIAYANAVSNGEVDPFA